MWSSPVDYLGSLQLLCILLGWQRTNSRLVSRLSHRSHSMSQRRRPPRGAKWVRFPLLCPFQRSIGVSAHLYCSYIPSLFFIDSVYVTIHHIRGHTTPLFLKNHHQKSPLLASPRPPSLPPHLFNTWWVVVIRSPRLFSLLQSKDSRLVIGLCFRPWVLVGGCMAS